MPTPLTNVEIKRALKHLSGWKRASNALEKTYKRKDFSEALGFIVRVGIEAERINHHPEICNVWNRVTLRLSTHDAGDRITQLDVDLAKAIQKIAR